MTTVSTIRSDHDLIALAENVRNRAVEQLAAGYELLVIAKSDGQQDHYRLDRRQLTPETRRRLTALFHRLVQPLWELDALGNNGRWYRQLLERDRFRTACCAAVGLLDNPVDLAAVDKLFDLPLDDFLELIWAGLTMADTPSDLEAFRELAANV